MRKEKEKRNGERKRINGKENGKEERERREDEKGKR